MTYKEQADTVTLEMEREEWDLIGDVFWYAVGAAMRDNDYARAHKIASLATEMNAPRSVYRVFTEWGV